MKFRILSLVAGILLPVTAAQARQQPTPPPSGVVVHLFGPNSITSNILPNPAAPSGNAAPPAAGTPQQAPAQASASYPEPTAGQIFHQMFVVGDPSKSPRERLAKGKTAK